MCPKDSVLSDPAPSSSGYNRPNLFSVFLSPRDLVTTQPRLMSPSTRTTQLLWVTLGGGGLPCLGLTWSYSSGASQLSLPSSHSWVFTGEALAKQSTDAVI